MAGVRRLSPSTSYIITVLAMAGKMAPRPSSPLSRSVTKATARSMARCAQPRREQNSARRRAARMSTPRKNSEPDPFLVRRLRRRADGLRRLDEQFVDGDAARIFRPRLQRLQHQQRHEHRARPVRHLGQVEREPARQQHDLDRHFRHGFPAQDAVEREQDAGEDVAVDAAAARQDRLAGARHVRRVGRVADHLQREIGLDAGAHVEGAVVEQRPAAVRALDAAQVDSDLALERRRRPARRR